ncbi:flagellar filament capping protein FliD [Sporolactobacillus inulinus]|uniref:Flagellar hook-associated protein 2 n=1 Tax=Sporolactobacillus inulinus CASD TaxID=1069536 RepID=A0A0U1QPT8_9BACL|nr:flagellar filament capping protein FliD [Sporolactobacillus inulinus]KLI02819.1 hypothetical protein SINU_06035 [Sporolactobacillus inulinus CASD]GEB78090.1 hypothetical protein SIN01_24350 [Sporolactobacillus inulinus]
MADSSSSGASIDSINSMIGATNSNRVSGLASGMDIDSIVAKLMTAESQPLIQMQQNLQLTEWQRDDYRSMNTLLSNLQSTTQTMKLQSAFLAKTTASSNPSVVTATAGATAGNVTYTLSNVTMATSAYNIGGEIPVDEGFDSSQSLYLMQSKLTDGVAWKKNPIANETIKMSSDGTMAQLAHGGIDKDSASTVLVDSEAYTIVDSVSGLGDTSGNRVYIDKITGALQFNHTISKDATITASYDYDSVNFKLSTYNQSGNKVDKEFDFDANTSLDKILSTISSSSIGVSAFYDPVKHQVSMTRTDTGSMNPTDGPEIEFNDSTFLTNTLKMTQAVVADGSESDVPGEHGGTDAEFTVNGLKTTRHSNTFALSGVTFTLQGNSTDPVTLKVNNDTDTVFKSISDFVDQYNDTIKQVNDKISEKRNRSYAPLTDAQKSSMKDSDITNWTDKAKSGMLANDSILSSALSKLRTNLYSPVSGTSNSKMDQLTEIGITTSNNYLDHGKLVIDGDKLKAAISTNPQAVMELFTKTGDTTSEQGIMQRLNTTLKNTMDRIEDKAGNTSMTYTQYSMGKSIDDMNDRIDAFKLRLQDIQTRYYNQFDAMEAAINQANSQAGYLQQFMGQ